jgi:large subunit ribosomal protein L23
MKSILIRPVISEKTLTLAASGWYTFAVEIAANKPMIAKAVSDFYKVKVLDTRVASMHGKMRRVGKMMKHTKKPDWKKAMVRLPKGQKIDAFEIAPTEEGAQA